MNMNIRVAIDHLMLVAADGHIATETGMYMHRLSDCEMCCALKSAQEFCETGEAGEFPVGTPVTVGLANGIVSHTETRILVQVPNIGLIGCLPVTVKKA